MLRCDTSKEPEEKNESSPEVNRVDGKEIYCSKYKHTQTEVMLTRHSITNSRKHRKREYRRQLDHNRNAHLFNSNVRSDMQRRMYPGAKSGKTTIMMLKKTTSSRVKGNRETTTTTTTKMTLTE